MQTLQHSFSVDDPTVTRIALVGFAAATLGLVVQDTFGVTRMVAGLGLALALAASTFAAADASTLARFGGTFTALVAGQLVFFGGPLGVVGGVGVAVLALGIAYTRFS